MQREKEDTGKWPVRFNLRLSEETAESFERFSGLSGIPMTTVLRSFLDGCVPAVDAMSDAMVQARAGNGILAADLLQKLSGTLVAQSELQHAQTGALRQELEAKAEASK